MKKKLNFIFNFMTCCVLFFLSISFFLEKAYTQTSTLDLKTEAKWITTNQSYPNQWLAFRKVFQVDQIPQNLMAQIAVDSKYWLYLNGQLVVREGGVKRGPTPTSTYFDDIKLSSYLKKGENVLSILVWYFGKKGFSHNSSNQAGLFFEAKSSELKLISDKSWKVISHPAYQTSDDVKPNFRLSESSIRYDARQELTGWEQSGFDDSKWMTAIESGTASQSIWGPLFHRIIPQWKDFGLKNYINAHELPIGRHQDELIIAKLPYNAQVTPYFKINASRAGSLIDIRTDNFEGGRAPNIHFQYLTKKGVQEFEVPSWINGHEVRYTVPTDVEIIELKFRETGYQAEFIGSFNSSDSDLNTLWEKSRRTLYVTMRDNYMDCPDRERAQWWGDAVNEIGEAFYVFDSTKGPLLAQKAILELIQWQRKDGVIYSPVPAALPQAQPQKDDGTWSKELPLQGLASVGSMGIWNYFLNTNDQKTLSTAYPAIKKYLQLWTFNKKGLVDHRAGDWDWGDWGKNIDMPVLENAWYFLALKATRDMAQILNLQNDFDLAQRQMNTLSQAFNKEFWTGSSYSSGTTVVLDDRAQALAVVAGLAQPETFDTIKMILNNSYEASPYMEKYVLESLFLMNAPDQAFERMKFRYLDQIRSPLTTLWEGWGLGKKGYGGGTYNHAWSGGSLTILSQYAAGISVQSPGWKKWKLQPQPGALQNITANVPTPNGNINLSYQRYSQSLELSVTVPTQTLAEVNLIGLPLQNMKTIKVNGVKKTLETLFELTSGQYKFIIE